MHKINASDFYVDILNDTKIRMDNFLDMLLSDFPDPGPRVHQPLIFHSHSSSPTLETQIVAEHTNKQFSWQGELERFLDTNHANTEHTASYFTGIPSSLLLFLSDENPSKQPDVQQSTTPSLVDSTNCLNLQQPNLQELLDKCTQCLDQLPPQSTLDSTTQNTTSLHIPPQIRYQVRINKQISPSLDISDQIEPWISLHSQILEQYSVIEAPVQPSMMDELSRACGGFLIVIPSHDAHYIEPAERANHWNTVWNYMSNKIFHPMSLVTHQVAAHLTEFMKQEFQLVFEKNYENSAFEVIYAIANTIVLQRKQVDPNEQMFINLLEHYLIQWANLVIQQNSEWKEQCLQLWVPHLFNYLKVREKRQLVSNYGKLLQQLISKVPDREQRLYMHQVAMLLQFYPVYLIGSSTQLPPIHPIFHIPVLQQIFENLLPLLQDPHVTEQLGLLYFCCT